MVSIKIITVVVTLAIVLTAEFVEAASKQQRHHIKHKKSTNNNGKSKASFKQAPAHAKSNQRNPKMNYHNSYSWPSANSFYRPASTTPLYLRSPSTTTYYPMHWGSSFYNTPSSLMPSTMLRRSDDFSSNIPSTMLPMMSSQMPLIPMGVSQTPTIIDMSAFVGSGLLDNPFTSSSQNIWPMEDVSLHSPKSKFNLYHSFNLNDDGPFGNLFNQFD